MKDRPVIFSTAMVRALLAGRKTQTRRLASSPLAKSSAGDALWVRESFGYVGGGDPGILLYGATWEADALAAGCDRRTDWKCPKLTPSIHMPRKVSRLVLALADVRFQRLSEITDADAIAEGIWFHGVEHGLRWFRYADDAPVYPGARDAYFALWQALHGADSLAENPEVVALTFAVHKIGIDSFLQGNR